VHRLRDDPGEPKNFGVLTNAGACKDVYQKLAPRRGDEGEVQCP